MHTVNDRDHATGDAQLKRSEPPGRTAFTKEQVEAAKKAAETAAKTTRQENEPKVLGCTGRISQVIDVGDESLRFTSAVFGTSPGGGEGAQFDKTPVLSTKVELREGACPECSSQRHRGKRAGLRNVKLNPFPGHPHADFRCGGGPRHMVGHFEPPFGGSSPAVALEAERDVDMYASNFFQKVGKGPHEVPPDHTRLMFGGQAVLIPAAPSHLRLS